MTTVQAETTTQRYERLDDEFYRLRRIHPEDRTDLDRQRLSATAAELAALLEEPPASYTFPKAAADLIDYARAHGWDGRAQWTPPGAVPVWVTVHIGRIRTAAEQDAAYLGTGDRWHYQLTWHSRGCRPGRVRRFGGLAETPDRPAAHDAPSLQRIRETIATHPGPVTA